MAITFNGTLLTGSVNDDAIRIGATIPVVTPTTGIVHNQSKEVTVVKATVNAPTEVATFNALVIAVDALLSGTVTNDFVATNTVTAHATLSKIVEVTEKYTDKVVDYVCTVNIFTNVV